MIQRAPRPTTGYTLIRDQVLRDSRLSYRARGVLVSILSRPDHWQTSAEALSSEGREGRDAIRVALSELEDAGYVQRVKTQTEAGTWITSTIVYDVPRGAESQPPKTDNQSSVNQPSVSQALKEKQPKETTIRSAERKTSRPADWAPNANAVEYAKANGIDMRHEVEQFKVRHDAKGDKFTDWDKAFRYWLGNAKKWAIPTQRVQPVPIYDTPPAADPESLPW